jgi:uncharacterized protein YdaU (DUF1376 family)
MNYYERHLGDYAKDAGHLSLLEHGAYTLLMDRYYSAERGIPEGQAYRIARAVTPAEKRAVDTVLAEFFTLREGLWINAGIDEKIEKALTRINAARENGRSGGRPKKPPMRDGTKPTGFPPGCARETQPKAHQAPDTNLQSAERAAATQSEAGEKPNPAADPLHGRANELATLLHLRGAAVQATNPRVRRWAEIGISDAQALQALQIAQSRREAQASPQPVNAGLLAAILHDLNTPTPIRRSIHDERADFIAELTGRNRREREGRQREPFVIDAE